VGLMPIYQAPNTSKPVKGAQDLSRSAPQPAGNRPGQVWCAVITLASEKRSTELFSYLPHPDAARVPVFGGDHGLTLPQGTGVAHRQ
jgi:hypothetical protein